MDDCDLTNAQACIAAAAEAEDEEARGLLFLAQRYAGKARMLSSRAASPDGSLPVQSDRERAWPAEPPDPAPEGVSHTRS